MSGKLPPIRRLLAIMAKLRSPKGCPWDREQDHQSLRFHAVEEVYELLDAIESRDDHELLEELGDVLLQVVFHCQLARERAAFDFDDVVENITAKLIRRHPHVFGTSKVKDVAGVWKQWEQIKRAEKQGTRHERPSAFDGIPKHLPALLRAEKLLREAGKAGLRGKVKRAKKRSSSQQIAQSLFDLAAIAESGGWSAEALLRSRLQQEERRWRKAERHGDSTKKRT